MFQSARNAYMRFFRLNVLDAAFLKVLAMHFFLLFYGSLQGAYVSTLVVRATNDPNAILRMHMLLFLLDGTLTFLAVFFIRRFSSVLSLKLGLAAYAAVCLSIVFFGERFAANYYLISLLVAAGNGFYYLAYNIIFMQLNRNENQDVGIGFMNFMNGAIILTIPQICGLIISFAGVVTGYKIVFGFGFCMLAAGIFFASRIKKLPPNDRRTGYRAVFKYCFVDGIMRRFMAIEFVKGLREGVFAFFLSLLIFTIIKSEALIGFNQLLTGVSMAVGSWLYARFVRPSNRIRYMIVSFSAMLTVSLILFASLSPATLILVNFCSTLFGLFFINPMISALFASANAMENAEGRKPELLGVRQLVVAAARFSGVFFAFVMPRSQMGSVLIVVGLTATQFISLILIRRVAKITANREAAKSVCESC